MDKTFLMGAINAFVTDDVNVYAFEGKVSGKVSVGDEILLTDTGVDGASSFAVTVAEISVRAGESFDSRQAVEDTDAIIYVNGGKSILARRGVVLHSKEAAAQDVRNAYLNVLGNIFVVAKDLEISEEELDKMTLSDIVDVWGCFFKYHGNKYESAEKKASYGDKLEKLMNKMRDKLFTLESVNALYSKATGEPFLYSHVYQEAQGAYSYTEPDILLATDARLETVKADFPESGFEFKKINGAAIKKFLEFCVNLNGAVGVKINGESVRIPANLLVEPFDAGENADINVINPEFVCWNLLIGQLGEINSVEKQLAYRMFSRELEKEILNATFLIPAQKEGDQFRVAVTENPGSEKPAVMMYSDWTRLRMRYDEKWSALTQKVSEVIDKYDVVFNAKNDNRPTMYITKEVFDTLGK